VLAGREPAFGTPDLAHKLGLGAADNHVTRGAGYVVRRCSALFLSTVGSVRGRFAGAPQSSNLWIGCCPDPILNIIMGGHSPAPP